MSGSAAPGAQVAGYLGRILDRDGEPAGTCFQVAPGVLVTAWHVLDEVGAASPGGAVRVDPLAGGDARAALVRRLDEVHDLAVLTAEPALPASAGLLTYASRLPLDTRVTVTGHAELEDPGHRYRYLTASGEWAGDTIRDGTVGLGSMTAGRVLPGMSGAPVVRGDGAVVGVVSGRYNSADGWLAGNVWVARAEDLRTLLDGIADVVMAEASRLSATWSYLERVVRHIAPAAGLAGRDGEMAEMAAFCQGSAPYLWWQADAWAGKSALMASFVLDPPPGVTVVSFFITARDASQSDSQAFSSVVLGQLEELADEDAPEWLADSGGDRYGALLRLAAHRVRARDRRLVLVVDGLDEDRGPQLHLPSIASLLPLRPDSLRVIVSSRPHPGLPADVPGQHPLRTLSPRTLSRSARAETVRAVTETELRDLLGGAEFRRDLPGLLAVARGALAIEDLAELTGAGATQISEVLAGVTGRTFTVRRADLPLAQTSTEGYLLAHDGLEAEAARTLGEPQLAGYRDRMIRWACGYQARGWPASTPVYLLTSYFRMLQAGGHDQRVISCAQDEARHDRMLAVSGGDTAALAEVGAAIELILAQPDPDLTAMTRLAVHREQLASRNQYLPAGLPAVWAALGQPGRAEALARSMTAYGQAMALAGVAEALAEAGRAGQAENFAGALPEPAARAAALAMVARVLAAAGQAGRALEVAGQAEAVAATITESAERTGPLGCLIPALVAAGQADRAATLAASVPEARLQGILLDELVQALVAAGQHDRGEQVARAIADPGKRIHGLTVVARALAQARQYDRAAEAAAAAGSISDPYDFFPGTDRGAAARLLAAVAQAMLGDGRPDRAAAVAAQAKAAADRLSRPSDQSDQAMVFAQVARVLEAAGQHRQARALIGTIPAAGGRRDLAEIRALTAEVPGGPRDRPAAEWDRAQARAAAITGPRSRAEALAALAQALEAAGQHDRAEALARSIERRDTRSGALAALAAALTGAGEYDRAETVAGAITDPGQRAAALTILARALAVVRQAERAARVADQAEEATRSAAVSFRLLDALVALAPALMAAGLAGHAAAAAGQAAEVARQAEASSEYTSHDSRHDHALAEATRALVATGEYQQAAEIAAAITDSTPKWQALGVVAGGLAAAGRDDEAEAVARAVADEYYRAAALSAVAARLVAAGRYDRAQALAGSAGQDFYRVRVSLNLAAALAAAGQAERAAAIALSIPSHARRYHAEPLVTAARALAAAGAFSPAIEVARRAEAGSRRMPGGDRTEILTGVTEVLAAAGRPGDAAAMARRAESAARSLNPATWQAQVLPALARRRDGSASRHDKLIISRDDQAPALATATRALVAAREYDRADAVARTIVSSFYQGRALRGLARALAAAGQYDRADAVATSITDLFDRAGALAGLAAALTGDGQAKRAAGAARRAAAAAQAAGMAAGVAEPRVEIATELAAAGHYDDAEAVARASTHSVPQAIAALAAALAAAGQFDRAEAAAHSITSAAARAEALTAVARARAAAGRPAPRLLAAALADDWTEPLRLGALPPEALLAATSLLVTVTAPGRTRLG